MFLLSAPLYLQGQQIISGKVSDAVTKESIIGATIQLLHSDNGTVTDTEGHFNLEGHGPIQISYIGYKKLIVYPDGDFLEILLHPEVTQLQTVEITGRVSKLYNSDYNFSATKIATRNSEIPQSISTVTKELIADRQAFRLGEVLKNVSGVSTVSFYNHYAIRGVTQNAVSIENRLVNGMRTSQIYFNQPLSTNIERVEVIKGPASMTFSNTDAGGSINMVTKKPLVEARQQVSLTAGSFNTMRGAMDFTGPINEEKTLLYRLNIGYEDALSYRDLQFKKAILVAPSFSYVPNDKTRINLEMTYSQDNSRLDRGQPIFGATAGVTNLNSTPLSFAIGASNDHYHTQETSFMLNLVHEFSKEASLNVSYMKQGWNEDLSEHRTSNIFARDSSGNSIPSLVDMQFFQRQQKWYTNNVNAFINIQKEVGKLKNNTVVGTDYIHYHVIRGAAQNIGRGFINADGTGAINTYDPSTPQLYQYGTFAGVRAPIPNVPYFDLQNPEYLIKNMSDYFLERSDFAPTAYFSNGFYVMNESRIDKFILNLGLRQEYYTDLINYRLSNEDKVTQKALLPRIGLTYLASNNINAYGVYTESYLPQSTASLVNPQAGGPFDPLMSNMIEFGTKTTWFGGALQGNLAVFEINQQNILISANDPGNVNLLRQRGRERYKGAETEIIGNILPNLQVNVAYAYIDARIIEDVDALMGLRKENTPTNNFSLWGRYDFVHPSVQGLGFGFGANHVGEKIPWFTRDFTIPAYTVADAAIYYSVKNMQMALNVNNIFDKEYWLGAINYTRLYPAAPRNAMLNVTYNF
ncbi:TonB-dependent receptor [Anditalea andensis]|nr:TonB-dependent receptor [Anditalea andensis]